MEAQVSIALFGFGRAGQIHVKNIYNNKRIDLKYIVEEYTATAQKFVAEYKLSGTQVVHISELNTVLNDASLQACVIATPTDTHEGLILASLAAGKAVMCEKPLANSTMAIGKYFKFTQNIL